MARVIPGGSVQRELERADVAAGRIGWRWGNNTSISGWVKQLS